MLQYNTLIYTVKQSSSSFLHSSLNLLKISLVCLQCLNINTFLQKENLFLWQDGRFIVLPSFSERLNTVKEKFHRWDKTPPGLRALTQLDMVLEESITCPGVTKSQNCNSSVVVSFRFPTLAWSSSYQRKTTRTWSWAGTAPGPAGPLDVTVLSSFAVFFKLLTKI